jgi:hypothetical protein
MGLPVLSLVTDPSGGNRSHSTRASKTPTKFITFDGEGMMVDGKHQYVLLGIGNHQIEDPAGLAWPTVFDFLYSHYRKQTAFCGFFLGYDFSQWLRSLPEERARRLLTLEGKAQRKSRSPKLHGRYLPVDLPGWQVDMLGMRRMAIRSKECDCLKFVCSHKKGPWQYLCDAGPFFQTSFLNVINPERWSVPVVTPDEYALILEGKARRASATLDDSMRLYNRLENEILARVLRELDRGFLELGVHLKPSQWFGPGQAAQVWMNNEHFPTRKECQEIIPDWFWEAAQWSYFGGWFELMMHGLIRGTLHEYDINNAYPYIISKLPCLLHGTYTRGIGRPTVEDNELCLVRARVWAKSPHSSSHEKHYIGTMLHRDPAGRITRPLFTEGWFWWHELEAARKAKLIVRIAKERCFEWMKYTPCDCLPPGRRVANLYMKRLAVGKKTPLGIAAKLIANSEYGKFAQTIGEYLKFSNPVYASLITAGCRTMILEAIASHPKGKSDVAMVATDGVYFLSPHEALSLSDRLGEWNYQRRENVTLFKPGVYWDDDARREIAEGNTPHFKARGIKASDFANEIGRIDREFDNWRTTNKPPPVELMGLKLKGWPEVKFVASFSMVTPLQALQRNNWQLAGYVEENKEFTQSSNPGDKRTDAWIDDNGICRTEPLWFGEGSGTYMEPPDYELILDVQSTPYAKRFGLEDPWSDESMQEGGITPDGYAGEEYRFITGKE